MLQATKKTARILQVVEITGRLYSEEASPNGRFRITLLGTNIPTKVYLKMIFTFSPGKILSNFDPPRKETGKLGQILGQLGHADFGRNSQRIWKLVTCPFVART